MANDLKDNKKKRGRPSKKVKLFSIKQIDENDLLKMINSEREIIKELKQIEKLILNVTLVFKERENDKIDAFYEIEIEEFKLPGKRPPGKKIYNLSELFPKEFPVMEASIQDVKNVHFSAFFNLREYFFSKELEEITGTFLVTRDYTRIETKNIFKYF